MVYYFKSRCGEFTMYMGKDKYENEDLSEFFLLLFLAPKQCIFSLTMVIDHAAPPLFSKVWATRRLLVSR